MQIPLAIPGSIGFLAILVGAILSTAKDCKKKQVTWGYILLLVGLLVSAFTMAVAMMRVTPAPPI